MAVLKRESLNKRPEREELNKIRAVELRLMDPSSLEEKLVELYNHVRTSRWQRPKGKKTETIANQVIALEMVYFHKKQIYSKLAFALSRVDEISDTNSEYASKCHESISYLQEAEQYKDYFSINQWECFSVVKELVLGIIKHKGEPDDY